MERAVTGYQADENGDLVAELACGHDQHVQPQPLLQLRDRIAGPVRNAACLGALLDCPLRDRTEMPDAIGWIRVTPVRSEQPMPVGPHRAHRIAESAWGRIAVHDGGLRFVAATSPAIETALEPGSSQAIPPEIDHEVGPLGAVRPSIEFFDMDSGSGVAGRAIEPGDEGGDPPCWAGLLCPECGAMVDRAGHHRLDCPLNGTTPLPGDNCR